ncbi:WD40 repeat-like protein, partial [Dichomitus squalens LYAD-421 SS1]
GHDSRATALVVSSDGRWVATASRDSTIILWDARDTNISQEWFSHDPGVWYLAFSPDSRYLASVGVDGKVIIWDISRSSHQVTVLEGYTTPLRGCSWSESGAYIAALDNDGTIRLWDGRTLQPLPLDGANKRQEDMLLFSPDGHWLFAHNLDSSGIWDVASGTYLALQRGGPDHPCSAAFSRSSTRVAVGYYRGSIHVWDIAARREPLLLEAHESFVHDVVFSPDGRLLLSASWDKTMKISDARTGAVVRSLDGHKGRVHKACFSPCGRYIASASVDKTVRVWRTGDGSCLATLSDHGEAVWEVAFTPDGTMLWSAADNGTVWGRRVQDIVPDDFEL